MLNRTQPPPIKNAIDFQFVLPNCNSTKLDNNIPLYWLNAGIEEVVCVDWVFKAGLWTEQKTAVAQAVAALLKNGTKTKNAFQINDAIEFYGASLKVGTNNDYTSVSLYTLTKHLEKLLPIVQDVIINPIFPEEELAIYKQNALQRLSVNLLQCDFVANRNIDAMIFGKQYPYGRFTEASDISALSVEDLIEYHKANCHPKNCTMFMSGKFSEAHVQIVQSFFGKDNWKENNFNPNEVTHVLQPSEEKKKKINNNDKGVQGSVRIARDFVTRSHPDFAPMLVLNTVLGGYFGSRLMSNIREEKGYTYGIYSSLYPTKYTGAIMISTEADSNICDKVVEEVYKEMNLLKEQAIDDEELLLVKNYLLGNLLGDLDGPFSIMQRWKTIVLNNTTRESFYDKITLYKNVTAQDLQALAEKYYRMEDFYELVVI